MNGLFYHDVRASQDKWSRPGLMTSDSVEWYTPRHILDAVVATLGAIDLDPCADPGRSVPAQRHFTEVDNGLGRPWAGRVYMNPPYGRTIISWTTKLRDEWHSGRVTQAVALLPARVDTRWWHELGATDVCLIRGRIQFSGYEQAAPFPSAALYVGHDSERFERAFADLGLIYRRVER